MGSSFVFKGVMNLVESKFSLELTKGGVQRVVFAKSGERGSRVVLITLTEAGKVFDASPYRLRVNFDSGESVSSTVTFEQGCVRFEIPEGALVTPGEKLCELKISNDTRLIYAPVFKIVVEQSIGQQNTEDIPFNENVHYQESIPNLNVGKNVTLNDEVALFDGEDTTRNKLSALPFVTDEAFDEHIESQAEVNKIVGANAIARHTHDNKEAVLDKLGVTDNKLTFDNQPIATELPDLDQKIEQKIAETPVSAFDNDMQYIQQQQLDTLQAEQLDPLWDIADENAKKRHWHDNQAVLDMFGVDGGGSPTFNKKPIASGGTSISPKATMAQTVVSLLESAETAVSCESPEYASSIESEFANNLYNLMSGAKLLYAPSNSGVLTYTDVFSFEEKTINVADGEIYEFYADLDAWEMNFNMYWGEQVLAFFKSKLFAE